MSQFNALGFGARHPSPREETGVEYVVLRHRLHRVLAFRGRTIDDVVNNPIVKNDILGYWKVLKQIDRRGEILELERQWNPVQGR